MKQMNKVTIEPQNRSVTIHPRGNSVTLKAVRIESHYHFLTPVQVVDTPKEREQ